MTSTRALPGPGLPLRRPSLRRTDGITLPSNPCADGSRRAACLRRTGGFTLIELVIVVAIVGLLAAIAVPSFLRMQLKAKRSEVFVNVKSIAMAEIAYEKVYDSYIACLSSPNTTLDTQLHPFDPTVDGWDKLEWIPDGWVRCHYYVQEFTNPKGTWVRPSGVCDMDGDKKYATWYMDVDPRATSSSSQNMVMRGDAPTMTYTRY